MIEAKVHQMKKKRGRVNLFVINCISTHLNEFQLVFTLWTTSTLTMRLKKKKTNRNELIPPSPRF